MKPLVVAKAVLLNDQDQVLLLRRSEQSLNHPGRVDFPGGTVEDHEDILTAASREVLEETGIKIAKEDLHVVYTTTKAYDDDSALIIRILCLGRLSGQPEVVLSHEHSEYWWQNFDDAITDFDHISWQEGLEFIKQNNLL